MKKLWKRILVFIIMVMCLPVFAAERSRCELVPAGESATVSTDLFQYEGISYSPSVSGKDYGQFTFQSIKNVSSSTASVSINILLFDSEKKNIGFVTYCSEQDYGGAYSQKKLNAGASTGYQFNVSTKFFVEGKTPADVSYYAVYDENSYCHVGGYTKYDGKTIEEIVGTASQQESGNFLEKFLSDPDKMNQVRTYSFWIVCLLFLFIGFIIVKSVLGRIVKAAKTLRKGMKKKEEKVVIQYADGTYDDYKKAKKEKVSVKKETAPKEETPPDDSLLDEMYSSVPQTTVEEVSPSDEIVPQEEEVSEEEVAPLEETSQEETFNDSFVESNISLDEDSSMDEAFREEEIPSEVEESPKLEESGSETPSTEDTGEGESELMNLFK